jgi:hypothetical protein
MIADAIRQHDEPFHRLAFDLGKVIAACQGSGDGAKFRPTAVEIDQVTGVPDEALVRTIFCRFGLIRKRRHADSLTPGGGLVHVKKA